MPAAAEASGVTRIDIEDTGLRTGFDQCFQCNQRVVFCMATEKLERQVEQERKELEAAPKVAIVAFQPRAGHGESGRCGWCGQFTDDLVIAEAAMADQHGNILRPPRYKGVKCCGGRHL